MIAQMKVHLETAERDITFLEDTIKKAKENIESQDYRDVDWKTVLSDSEQMLAIYKKIREKLVLDIKMLKIK